jgi:magnesium-dependent phosphatase-1
MYQLWGGGSPFQIHGDGTKYLHDCNGTKVRLLGISGQILHDLKFNPLYSDVICAFASTTDEPEWAHECLQKFHTTTSLVPLITCVDSPQIYKANKQKHFQKMKEEYSNVNLQYHEMLFFDNEMYNINSVKKLGVHCVYCPDGMTQEIWESGLAQYAVATAAGDQGRGR